MKKIKHCKQKYDLMKVGLKGKGDRKRQEKYWTKKQKEMNQEKMSTIDIQFISSTNIPGAIS